MSRRRFPGGMSESNRRAAAKKAHEAKKRKAKAEGRTRVRRIKADKAGARKRGRGMPEPTAAPAEGKREYLLMVQLVMDALPAKAPGASFGDVLDQVRSRASKRDFPGDTHRTWAKQVLLDLKAAGLAAEDGETSAWRRA